MNVGPAVVMVIRKDGIRRIRLVASTAKEEKAAIALYTRIMEPVHHIEKILTRKNRGNRASS